MSDKPISQVQKGLIISLIIIVLSTAFYFIGWKANGPAQYFLYAILLGGIIWACNGFAKSRNGNITFGNVFGYGFKISAVIACIMVVFSLLFMTAFPEMKVKVLEEMRLGMEQNPSIKDDQLDAIIKAADENFLIINIGSTLFGYMFMGTIASLIAAGVVKKNPDNTPFTQQ